MTKFSSIKPQKKQETPADAEETTATAPAADVTGGTSAQEGFSTSDFIGFISTPREMPPAPEPAGNKSDSNTTETDTDASDDTETDEDAGFVKRSMNWFKGAFTKDEGPVADEMKVEMDEEMYGLTASLGTGFSDTIIPSLIAKMHGDREPDEWKLKDEPEEGKTTSQRDRLNRAWELYFRSIRMRVTPLTYLLGVLAQIWGIPLLGGFMQYWSRMSIFGFHWPWSDKWKLKAYKMQQAADKAEGKTPEPAPANTPPPPAEPTPEPAKPDTELQICKYWQWQTDNGRPTTVEKVFQKGKGFPKTSKHKNLVQQFGSQTAYVGYLNSTKKLGKQK